VKKTFQRDRSEHGVPDADHETEHHRRLFDQLRTKLLDLSRKNPMLNYRHRVGSRRQLRIVDCDLEMVLAELAARQGELAVEALPEPDDIPSDERTASFLAALGQAKAMDLEYLTRLQALDAVARQDDAALADLDRWLREHVRQRLGLPPRPDRSQFNVVEHARKHGIEPAYELARRSGEAPRPLAGLQTLYVADELDSRLARIAADARLAEQETGLSTLFLAFGFLRWYERNDGDVANFAPLLLLPVELKKRMEGRRAIYTVRAVAEFPEINLSLREWLARASPSRKLPEFDEENDVIESYFRSVEETVAGLDRWRVERNLTLGHFAFGRLAMYADLAPENWPTHPAGQTLVQSLLHGSEAAAGDDVFFAPDYDLDDDKIEDIAPILINDADASQHSAIIDVMKGKNLVVEGPPGTGKSQTITNILANALYAGKTVLFLADKLAALQVVKGRMDAAGLGDFCLELHSDKAQPKSIILSLQQRYEMGRDRGYEPAWPIDLRKLRSARGRVREYLNALHAPDEVDGRTPFALFWSAIAARRELGREFEAVRRVDLSEIFSGGPEKIEEHADALKLFVSAVGSLEQRYGRFADSPWTKANFAPAADCEPRMIADLVRDTHDAALRLHEIVAARSAKLQIELPRLPSKLAEWMEAAGRLPAIPEDTLLAQVSSFTPGEILAAADLARMRLAVEDGSAHAVVQADPVAVGYLAQQADACGLVSSAPFEVVAHADKMSALKTSLLDGLKKMSSLVAAFGPGTEPDVAVAAAMAEAVRFAAAIPPHLDAYLWFDGASHEDVLSDGAQRIRLLTEAERALDEKFQRNERGEWPPVEELRIAASVTSATGLRPFATLVTGQRTRAGHVLRTLGVAFDTPDVQSDIETLIFHIEARERFLSDKRLAAAAGAFWAEFSTPFEQLAAVTRLRAAFAARTAGLGEIGQVLKTHLFSSNAKIVEKLRSYQPWVAKFHSDLAEWPESCSAMALRQAATWIEQRAATFGQLAEGIRELGLADANTSFDLLRRNADRRLQIWELETKIADDPVLAAVGETVWRSPRGCEALRETVGLSQAVATANPPAGIRARVNSAEGPAFARLLEGSVVSIGLAAERYRRDVARLAALTGIPLDAETDDPAEVADFLAPLLAELPSLGEWLDAARRRAHVGAIGLEPLIAAFDDAGLSFQRLPATFEALEVFYRAALAKRRHAALQNMKSLDIENERRRFAATDQTLKARQREAVRIKLLGNAIPSGTCAGRKKDWTELHCLRNELTKQARHIPIRSLLSRSRRAIQAMKPCFMMSPLSLAKYLPSQAMNFDFLVIDEASQMKPEDALGGLLRARQVIVVGDRNQLPPTDFFTRVTPAEEFGADADEDADDLDAESILDWALKTYQAPRRLKWHYRSRCESLIAFSNREFYSSKAGSSGDLITFPNARPGAFSIDLVRVDGSYKAARNPAEVIRVVEAAIEFMVRNCGLPSEEIPTLGIAAMNLEQCEAIREEFNRAARDPAVERYLAACNAATATRNPEPFFVKNLENLQGDERDVIMISLTYGRELGQTRVAQRFGPITGSQGHRRLNVLFTRARRRVVLFSSMGSNDVLVSAGSGRGVRVLRDYLRYVESRRLEAGEATGRGPDSDFEREVRARLEAEGLTVDPEVGVAAYRIDLAVRNPSDPTVYLAGIECDGAAFHSAKSARDRDRLREMVLQGLGWNVLRVWSTDWFSNPEGQTAKLVDDLFRLAEKPVAGDKLWLPNGAARAEAVAAEPPAPVEPMPTGDDVDADEPGADAGAQDVQAPAATPDEIREPAAEVPAAPARLSQIEVRNALRSFRDEVILKEYPGSEPERCILRDLMINKILESRLDEPEQFDEKIPLWLRERTDQRQIKYLRNVCAIVEKMA
jgi:very-short-patch-repair endonuclease